MYAITLTVNGRLCNRIEELQRQGKEIYGTSFIFESSYAPHITLVSGLNECAIKEVKDIVRETALTFKRFKVEVKDVSVFCLDKPLVHVRWFVSTEMERLRSYMVSRVIERCGDCYTKPVWDEREWMAKTSLFGYDTEYDETMLRLIGLAREAMARKYFIGERISLIEYGVGKEKEVWYAKLISKVPQNGY